MLTKTQRHSSLLAAAPLGHPRDTAIHYTEINGKSQVLVQILIKP